MGKKKKHESPAPKKEPQRYELNKIIYFDKETIKNILQEYNKGTKQTVVNSSDSSSVAIESNIEAEADIKLPLPFLSRLRFLFSSKISAEYISRIDETVTVTSTEISDFEKIKDGNVNQTYKVYFKIKDGFAEFVDVTISDIENSATFFRVAGNYIRILKGGVKDVDTKEFKSVMEGYEGYDHYKIDDSNYIRFNTSAFLSNYKRNDLLNSRLRIYCIFIGKFPKSNFNFIEQLNKMQKLSTGAVPQTLGELYPSLNGDGKTADNGTSTVQANSDEVALYDVVYASIIHQGGSDENN